MRTRHDPACPSYQWGRIHDNGVTCRICDAIDALREQVAKGREAIQHGNGENP